MGIRGSIQRVGVEEGLDERGEAPPPYVADGKPPGFGEGMGREVRGKQGGDFGVRDLPGYQERRDCLDGDASDHEVWSQVDIGDMRRPGQVLTNSNT